METPCVYSTLLDPTPLAGVWIPAFAGMTEPCKTDFIKTRLSWGKCRYEIGVILDGPVVADRAQINAKLLDARRNGAISREEYQDGLNPDIIACEVEDTDQSGLLAIVEASVTFNQDDLEIAARRAAVIAKVTGSSTAAFMATHFDWPDEVNAIAQALGVAIIRHEDPDYQDIE